MVRKELKVNRLSTYKLTQFFHITHGRLHRTKSHPRYRNKGPVIRSLFVSVNNNMYRVSHILYRLSTNCRKIPIGLEIDHINRNHRDDRVKNLRLATFSQSQSNRDIKAGVSGYRGVYPNGNYWRARIKYKKRRYNIGTFDTKKEAAKVYNEYAVRLFGKYAVLNKV